jgi:hypothetical protein
MLLMKQVLRVMKWCALATFCGAFAVHLARVARLGGSGFDVTFAFQLFER